MQFPDFATAFAEIDFYLSDNAEDIFPRCNAIHLHVIVLLIKCKYHSIVGILQIRKNRNI